MRRRDLKEIADKLAEEYRARPPDYWADVQFPLAFEQQVAGQNVQVELSLLEDKPEYLQVGVAVSGHDFWSPISPVCRSFIVAKGHGTEKKSADQ